MLSASHGSESDLACTVGRRLLKRRSGFARHLRTEGVSAGHPGRESVSVWGVYWLVSNCSTYQIEDDPDHQTATGADGDILLVAQVLEQDLELVAARARVVVHLLGCVEGHVLDLDLVINGNFSIIGHFCIRAAPCGLRPSVRTMKRG